MTKPSTVLRAVLAGSASGGRSTYGLAALALSTPSYEKRSFLRRLAGRPAKAVTLGLAGVELTMDKLPSTPPRTEPVGLIARAASAGLCGVGLARRRSDPVALPVLGALAGAALGSFGGLWWRRSGAAQLGLDPLAAALAEDALAAGLAALAVVRS